MSLLCKVDGIPVFYNARDAKDYGAQYGLKTLHTHEHDGRTGYMPASSHAHAVNAIRNTNYQVNEDALLDNWAGVKSTQAPTTTYQVPDTSLLDEADDLPSTYVPNIGQTGGGY